MGSSWISKVRADWGSVKLESDNELRRKESFPYVESSFYEHAGVLRSRFHEQMNDSIQTNCGLTPLSYVFLPGQQFLNANAEQIFDKPLVADLLDRLSCWAADELECQHISTPQLRVFVQGCSRSMAKDGTPAKWHFILPLSSDCRAKTDALRLAVLNDGNPTLEHAPEIGASARVTLDFNQLIVHLVANYYSIEIAKSSMDPAGGAVLLDGYLW